MSFKSEGETDDEYSSEDSECGVDDTRVFHPRPSLPAPRIELRSLRHLMDELDKETIDLDPDYQRDVVWSRERKMGLIDSIIENHYIPPIIFNRELNQSQDDGPRVKRVCIDGKQRLSSIKAFIDGEIGCHDRTGSVWYYKSRKGRRTIQEHAKDTFQSRQLITYEYPDLSRAQQEGLFARVQKGVQLTNSEKVRATTGPWQDYAKLYERDFPQVIGLSETKRGKSFYNLITSIGQILEVRRSLASGRPPYFGTTKSIIQALLKNVEEFTPNSRDAIRRTFTKFTELIELAPRTFQDNAYTHAKLFSPLDFMATSVMISSLMEHRTDQFLLESIRIMRLYLRQCFKDLRVNKSSWNIVWPFIECLFPQQGQEATGSILSPKVNDLEETPANQLRAIRVGLARRLARLNPAINPEHLLATGHTDSEPFSVSRASRPRTDAQHVVDREGAGARSRLQDGTESGSILSERAQSPESRESKPKGTQARSFSTMERSEPEPVGLRKRRRLERFTASGSTRKAQRSGEAKVPTIQVPDSRSILGGVRGRGAPLKTEAQDQQLPANGNREQDVEAAAQLLAEFKPHHRKAQKIKTEEAQNA